MEKIKFNNDWFFTNMDSTVTKRKVVLPHDAMQTEKRIPGLKNGEATGYYPGGKYLYEKIIKGDERLLGKTVVLEFEGIYQKSSIYLNGELIGGHIYGYTDFFVELTGKIKPGENILKVIVDNTQTPNSRWYTGSGIYRDVYLYIGGKEHIVPGGIRVRTESINPAVLDIRVLAETDMGTEIISEIFYKGTLVASAKGAEVKVTVPDAKLWSADSPELYDVRVSLVKNGEILDISCERTGIRQLSWSHDRGFSVNGVPVKLRGGCIHHDNGPIGACSFYTAELRRVKKLKEAGFNAVRYAHNPAGKAFLDACDEAGMYVMDEAFDMWECKKSDRDYGIYFSEEWEKDITAMIRVAYNHPSVILYSIGNEILDIGLPSGREWTTKLVACCHNLDNSRPVLNAFSPGLTCMAAKGIGINKFEAKADDSVNPKEVNKDSKASGSKLVNILITLGPLMMKFIGGPKKLERLASPSIEQMDISGYNYGLDNYSTHMKNHPDCILVGSETFNSGIWEHWKFVEENPCMIGEFTWTAWDYLGESGIGVPRYEGMSKEFSYPYPCVSAGCGCFDLIGDLDGQGAYVLSVWEQLKKPYIGVCPLNHYGEKVSMGRWRAIDARENWTWDGFEGRKARIQVIAGRKAEWIALYKNGISVGKKVVNKNMAVFETVYEPGILEAVVYDKTGAEIGRNQLKSAGKESILTVSAEKTVLQAVERDLAYLDIYIMDKEGCVKALDNRKISIEVEGPGELLGLGTGNPLPEELFTESICTAYNGHVLAVIRGDGRRGKIKVTARSEGLKEASTIIESR